MKTTTGRDTGIHDAQPQGDGWRDLLRRRTPADETRERLMKLRLLKEDPKLLATYEAWDRQFDKEASAAALARWLKKQGYEWAPHRNTVARWLNRIQEIESEVGRQA